MFIRTIRCGLEGSQQQQHLNPTSSIPNFKVEPDPGGASGSGIGDDGFTPVSAQGKTMSSPDLHLNSQALGGKFNFSILIRILYIFFILSGFKQHSSVLSTEALMAFQSASSSTGPTTLTVPVLNGHHSLSAQSSPGGSIRSGISPVQGMSGGTSLAE